MEWSAAEGEGGNDCLRERSPPGRILLVRCHIVGMVSRPQPYDLTSGRARFTGSLSLDIRENGHLSVFHGIVRSASRKLTRTVRHELATYFQISRL